MNTNEAGHGSLNSNSTLQDEEKSVEPKTSPTIITLAVVMVMGASTTLSIASGDYTSPKLTDLETFSLSKGVPKPNDTAPPSQEISPSKGVVKPDAATPPSQSQPTTPSPSAAVNTPEKITDSAELQRLEGQLFDALDRTWTIPVTETSIYVVRVDETGAIAAYSPINSIAQDNLENTPLPELIQPDSLAESENATVNFAEFQVIFGRTGLLEVQPPNLQPEEDF